MQIDLNNNIDTSFESFNKQFIILKIITFNRKEIFIMLIKF